jgi:YARHG domain
LVDASFRLSFRAKLDVSIRPSSWLVRVDIDHGRMAYLAVGCVQRESGGGMTMVSRKIARATMIVAISAATLVPSFGALAQGAASMSCGELWYARNAIYARNGYCFQTAQARATFGPGCFAPYGELRGYERSRVNELQGWERRRGC